jgi:hypothetical protein
VSGRSRMPKRRLANPSAADHPVPSPAIIDPEKPILATAGRSPPEPGPCWES